MNHHIFIDKNTCRRNAATEDGIPCEYAIFKVQANGELLIHCDIVDWGELVWKSAHFNLYGMEINGTTPNVVSCVNRWEFGGVYRSSYDQYVAVEAATGLVIDPEFLKRENAWARYERYNGWRWNEGYHHRPREKKDDWTPYMRHPKTTRSRRHVFSGKEHDLEGVDHHINLNKLKIRYNKLNMPTTWDDYWIDYSKSWKDKKGKRKKQYKGVDYA